MLRPISPAAVLREINNVGAHKSGENIMVKKSGILPFKITGLRTPGVNILKQEMLSCGGECVTPMEAITCDKKYCDVVLLGTVQHYKWLCTKLEKMQYFGLGEVQKELQKFLNLSIAKTVLASGKEIVYDHTVVMGVINITPDSFFSASRVTDVDKIVEVAGKMLKDGAEILDIGGESSRPGADAVTEEEEIKRVVPAIRAIKEKYPECIISIDTYHSKTALSALEAGADILNDITAGQADDNMLRLAAEKNVPIILMHMRGNPKNMQSDTHYDNVVDEVTTYLLERAKIAEELGLGFDKVILDPGIGFAKTTEDNLKLIQDIAGLTKHGYPVLLAASRKTVIGDTLHEKSPEDRLEGTLAISAQAVNSHVEIVRVHDVVENTRVIRMLEAIKKCQ